MHQFTAGSVCSCACTSLASHGDGRIVSVGEDGCLNVLALETARTRYDATQHIGGHSGLLSSNSLCVMVINANANKCCVNDKNCHTYF